MNKKEVLSFMDVGYIHRVIVGCSNPESQVNEEKIKKQMAEVNRCITGYPKGKIIGVEKNFFILNIGEHQAILQYLVYHIGFLKKPDFI
mgnify:CR=1 FL=1